ncbi:serine/threonine-protein kinase ULK3-like isoform X2 [Ischnura elegans]|uniref:serine/threonine-protein kinase ULK3-like isoform X2 n=1 Tax=Ischnura elegans TaxID=197161 RepID=UPI001ED8A26C|nr:serine/threonine-protein kinase ULK3-like isoform X2 [Ischnura elegans]
MTLPTIEGYVIVEKIGSGTYSTVYKAFKKEGDRGVVAVKCVDKGKLSGSAVDNIVTEISLLKKLKHEHIVEMKDFSWDARCIYIIMEFCGGGDLSCFIKRRQKLPEATCKRFLQQLASALKYLRSKNVCHMDLKPQNLLLTSRVNPKLKLADFGFAQYLSDDDKECSLRGSPLYMAPEMLLNAEYDARVDLWSVGVIAYECLFGRAPYSSQNFQELADKIKARLKIEVPPASQISKDCRDLLAGLLQHDPNSRIDFEDFFKHPFLDLEHMPSEESYQKAIALVKEAVVKDSERKWNEAFKLYCDSLLYFIPTINAEVDAQKRMALKAKVDEYINRAEDLKLLLNGPDSAGGSNVARAVMHDSTWPLSPLCSPLHWTLGNVQSSIFWRDSTTMHWRNLSQL